MDLHEALECYIDEIEGYEKYMNHYEKCKVDNPTHAQAYKTMADHEMTHAETILDMNPKLKDKIGKLAKYAVTS